MERWKGKIAVVTGSSSGIGAAVAEALVTSGLEVVGLARRKHLVEELALKLKDKEGKLHAIQVDVAIEEDILSAFKWIKDNLGPINILVNNAAEIKRTTLADGDTKMWKNILDINVIGLSIATREAIKDMRANNTPGHIIHMNSLFGHKVPSVVDFNMYPASKFATTALAETLRHELNALKSKIKISSISPGGTETDLFRRYIAENNLSAKDVPLLQPEDVASAVLFVLGTPPHVQIQELILQPIGEIY